MKVKTAIEYLKEYEDPEKEILIEYWDKDSFAGIDITDDEWERVLRWVSKAEVFNEIYDLVNYLISEFRGNS